MYSVEARSQKPERYSGVSSLLSTTESPPDAGKNGSRKTPERWRQPALDAVGGMLTQWLGSDRLGRPDEAIRSKMLSTIGGDSEEHLQALVSWFKSLHRRGRTPEQPRSWAWFTTVLSADVGAHTAGQGGTT